MTHAADNQEEQKDPGLAGLVLMLPILVLMMVFAAVAQSLDRLKQLRRTRPMPATWRDMFDQLRTSEWHIHQLLANGTRQLFETGDIDLNTLAIFQDVPDDFVWPEPKSAFALHLRMEGLARFFSDPVAYIRRNAERIRAREAEGANLILRSAAGASRRTPDAASRSSSSRIENGSAVSYYDLAWALGIPAPP